MASQRPAALRYLAGNQSGVISPSQARQHPTTNLLTCKIEAHPLKRLRG